MKLDGEIGKNNSSRIFESLKSENVTIFQKLEVRSNKTTHNFPDSKIKQKLRDIKF